MSNCNPTAKQHQKQMVLHAQPRELNTRHNVMDMMVRGNEINGKILSRSDRSPA